MNCRDFKEIADVYLDGELSVETTHTAQKHAESCSNCRKELVDQQLLSNRVKLAIKENPENQISQVKIDNLLNRARAKAMSPTAFSAVKSYQGISIKNLIPTAAGLLVIVGVIIFARYSSFETSPVIVQENNLAVNSNIKPNNYSTGETIQATKIAWRELITDAASEHEFCTLKNLRSEHNNITDRKQPFSVSKGSLEGVVQASLQKSLNKTVRLSESHVCESTGKHYTHLIFKDGAKSISVMIANSEGLTGSEDAMYCESTENYQVACFTAKNQTVFVVSDLNEKENLKIARSISPGVRQYLEKSKSGLQITN